MFTAFMSDASNIMSFYGDVNVEDGVGYAVEWWVFKPQKSGKQVIRQKNIVKLSPSFHNFVLHIRTLPTSIELEKKNNT